MSRIFCDNDTQYICAYRHCHIFVSHSVFMATDYVSSYFWSVVFFFVFGLCSKLRDLVLFSTTDCASLSFFLRSAIHRLRKSLLTVVCQHIHFVFLHFSSIEPTCPANYLPAPTEISFRLSLSLSHLSVVLDSFMSVSPRHLILFVFFSMKGVRPERNKMGNFLDSNIEPLKYLQFVGPREWSLLQSVMPHTFRIRPPFQG